MQTQEPFLRQAVWEGLLPATAAALVLGSMLLLAFAPVWAQGLCPPLAPGGILAWMLSPGAKGLWLALGVFPVLLVANFVESLGRWVASLVRREG